MVPHGFWKVQGPEWHPVASSGGQAPCAAGSIPCILSFGALEAWIWRPGGLEEWMLDAGRIELDWNGWLLDGRRDWKKFPHTRSFRRSADFC
jgi:hypothetical protein